MPAFPRVQFVSAPSTSATVRYDFNTPIVSGKVHILHEAGFSLGVPTLEGEPDGVGVEYGLRTITFTQRIQGTRPNAMARQSALARELMRVNNWLMVQIAADRDPVWFLTYRPEPEELSFEHVTDSDGPDAWDVGIAIPAEPFAYGARVTLGSVTVTNDPSSGTNRISWTTDPILGDAPAPCRVQVNPSSLTSMPGFRWMIAHAALDDAYSAPIVWPVGTGDGFTAGTDTAAATADADYSGGSYRAVSFANTNLVNRLSGSVPSAPPRGRYKVLVRIARSDLNSTFSLRFGQNVGGSYVYGDTVLMDRAQSANVEHATYVDLGEFNFPRGSGQVPDDLVATVSAPDISLQMGRFGVGAGSARIDCFVLIPVSIKGQISGSVLFSEFTRIGIDSGGGLGVWDGDAETFWAFNSSSGLFTPMPVNEGGYPVLVPGATNVFHLLQQVNGAKPFFTEDSIDDILMTTAVVISYHPRWLYLGDG